MDLIPPISEGLLAAILEAALGASVGLFFLCCSDCLSFFQATESFALGRMFALAEQGFFDALSAFGPILLGAVLGAVGGALGGVATANRS